MLLGTADKVLWVECKTGDWQSYVKHFRTINAQFLHLPPTQAVLVLLGEVDEIDKASNGELTSMTVLDMVEFWRLALPHHRDALKPWIPLCDRSTL